MPTNYTASSPYFETPQTNVFVEYLDFMVYRRIPATPNDEEIVIEPRYNQRPDLLAAELYGNPRLYWVFASRNIETIIDPIYDFVAGTTIMAPERNQLLGRLGL